MWQRFASRNPCVSVTCPATFAFFSIFDKDISDISIYLGSNFHFVVYPTDHFGNCNFISIIKKNLSVNELRNLNDYDKYDFMQKFSLSLKDEITKKTSTPT